MKFECWVIGKTKEKFWQNAESEYLKRISRYTKFNYEVIPDKKPASLSPSQIKLHESQRVLKKLQPGDWLIILDEKGKEYRSTEFSQYIELLQQKTNNRVIFLIGGAYGFDKSIYSRANAMLSLSKMTFSHQMIRSFFFEQLYRAFSIINNEQYHNE